ncbi:MAG: cell division protein ZapA, partial [Clostridium sp.]
MVKITVNINGVDYNLRGKESEEYLRDIASYVDERIKEVIGKNPVLSISQASVLAAVNITDELYKSDTEIRNIVGLKNNLEKERATLFKTIEDLKKDIIVIKEDNTLLKERKDNAIKGLKDDREKFFKELEETKKEGETLKNNVSSLLATIKEKESEIKKLNEENKKYKDENVVLKERNNKNSKELNTIKESLRVTENSLKKEINILKERNAKSSKEIETTVFKNKILSK